MARLSDAGRVTEELEQLVRRLHEEVTGGRSDLVQVVALADEIAATADSLASTFTAVDRQLRGLGEAKADTVPNEQRRATRQPQRRRTNRKTKPGGAGRRASGTGRAEAADEPTKSDLLEQAKEAAVPGRSSMSKDELAEAVEAHEQQTKDELLDQAKELGIAGRSEMSKQELLEAVRTEAAVSRDELLERAEEAEIPGRSEMSKEQLREALQR